MNNIKFFISIILAIITDIIITILIVAGVLYITNRDAELEFSVEYLTKADIMLMQKSVKSIDCFNEYFDASGIKKYSCIVTRKVR